MQVCGFHGIPEFNDWSARKDTVPAVRAAVAGPGHDRRAIAPFAAGLRSSSCGEYALTKALRRTPKMAWKVPSFLSSMRPLMGMRVANWSFAWFLNNAGDALRYRLPGQLQRILVVLLHILLPAEDLQVVEQRFGVASQLAVLASSCMVKSPWPEARSRPA